MLEASKIEAAALTVERADYWGRVGGDDFSVNLKNFSQLCLWKEYFSNV